MDWCTQISIKYFREGLDLLQLFEVTIVTFRSSDYVFYYKSHQDIQYLS